MAAGEQHVTCAHTSAAVTAAAAAAAATAAMHNTSHVPPTFHPPSLFLCVTQAKLASAKEVTDLLRGRGQQRNSWLPCRPFTASHTTADSCDCDCPPSILRHMLTPPPPLAVTYAGQVGLGQRSDRLAAWQERRGVPDSKVPPSSRARGVFVLEGGGEVAGQGEGGAAWRRGGEAGGGGMEYQTAEYPLQAGRELRRGGRPGGGGGGVGERARWRGWVGGSGLSDNSAPPAGGEGGEEGGQAQGSGWGGGVGRRGGVPGPSGMGIVRQLSTPCWRGGR
jgi:hypothetical protein